MAGISGREILIMVRAQNQASNVFRRVGADLSALGRKEQIRARQSALDLQKGRLQNKLLSQQAALRQLNSRAGLAQQRAALNSVNAQNRLGTQRTRNLASQIFTAQKISDLENKRTRIIKAQNTAYKNIANLRKSDMDDASEQAKLIGQQQSRLTRLNRAYGSVNNRLLGQKGILTALRGELFNQYGALQKISQGEQAAAESSKTHMERRQALNRSIGITRQELTQVAEKQRALNQETKAFRTERIGNAAHLLGSMGRQLQLVGLGGAAALGFAANAAAQLSTSVTLATTQYVNNVRTIKTASDQNFGFIIDQMNQFPSSAEDMASSLYDIFSTLNVSGKQGRDVLEQVNKAAVAGQLSTKDATAGVLSVLGNFKSALPPAEQAAEALNRSFAAVRFGRMTMAEFQATLQTTAPAAKQAQQTFDTLAGTMAFLSRSLGPTKAAVGFARLTEVLGSKNMQEGLAEFGVKLTDASGRFLPLNKQIDILVKRFPYLAEGGQKALNFFKDIGDIQGTIQARRAFVTLTQDTEGYNDILNKTINDNNEFDKSFRALNQTAGVQFAKALNVLKSLWLELGRAAIPTIASLFSPISELASKLHDMDQATKDSIGRFLALGIAITGVTGIVLSIASALGGAVLILGALEGPMLLGIAAGFIAIGAAIYLIINNWDKIGPRLQSALPALQNAVENAVGGIANILEKVSGLIANFVGIVDALIRGDWGDLWNSAGEAIGHFSDLLTIAVRGIGQIFSTMISTAASSVQGFIAITVLGTVGVYKFITALRGLATAYKAVAIASTTQQAMTAGGGGLGASIGAGLGNMLANTRGLVGLFKMARAETGSTSRALISLLPLFTSVSLGVAAMSVGITVAVAAAAVGIYLLWKAFDSGPSAADKAMEGIKQAVSGFKDLSGSLETARDAQMNLSRAKLDLRAQNVTIADYKKQLDKAKVGTDAYRTAEANLNQAQLDRQSTLISISNAQETLNATLAKSVDISNKAGRGLQQYMTNRGGLSDTQALARQPLPSFAGGGGVAGGAQAASARARILAARADTAEFNKAFADTVKYVNDATRALNQFAAAGGNISRGNAAVIVHNIADDMSLLLTGTHDATRGIEAFAQILGRVPTQTEIQFYSNIDTELIPGVSTFARIMHALPSSHVITFLSNHKQIQLSVAALTASLGHLPSKKQIRFLADHREYDAGIAHYIEKYHRLPDAKHLKIIVDNADANKKLDEARKKVQTLTTRRAQIVRIAHAQKIDIDTSQVDRKIAAARGKVQKLDAEVGKKRTKNFDIVFHPDASTAISNANALGVNLGQGIVTGLNSQIGAAAAAGAAVANAAIEGGRSAKGADAQSPSKKAAKRIGKPIAEGIIKGMTDEFRRVWTHTAVAVQRLILKGLDLSGTAKEKGKAIAQAYGEAMDTAIQTLKDKWEEIHDLNQQNFGELFQGEGIATKIEWGQKLNIGDLQKDLNKQLATFRDFNASLNRLRRRGGPQSLIDALRQLGPAAQGELDALNGATKSELKKYERTWKASQKAINRATKQQFKQQVKEWKSQGKAIAAGILMGLRGEQGNLEKYFRHIWQRMIHTTRKHNKSHSPSRLYAQEGVNVIEGFRMGMERASRGMTVPSPGVGPAWGRRGAHAGAGGGMVINQTIHAHHSESLDTTLRKANFRLKHRNT